jgi:hypothetical protein
MDLELVQWLAKEDGGMVEPYRGTLMVTGVRSAFEVLLLADANCTYFVASLLRFAPVDWSAGTRVA